MNDHHPLYEDLTIEEKLLVDKEMRKWWAGMRNFCLPKFMVREAERRIIEELERKEKKWEIN